MPKGFEEVWRAPGKAFARTKGHVLSEEPPITFHLDPIELGALDPGSPISPIQNPIAVTRPAASGWAVTSNGRSPQRRPQMLFPDLRRSARLSHVLGTSAADCLPG